MVRITLSCTALTLLIASIPFAGIAFGQTDYGSSSGGSSYGSTDNSGSNNGGYSSGSDNQTSGSGGYGDTGSYGSGSQASSDYGLTPSNFTDINTPSQVQNIPTWVKNNAGWWAQGQIGDGDFVKGIQYLIQQGIITIPPSSSTVSQSSSNTIPAWVKNNAGWWAQGQIGDGDFVKGIQYLINAGIIQV